MVKIQQVAAAVAGDLRSRSGSGEVAVMPPEADGRAGPVLAGPYRMPAEDARIAALPPLSGKVIRKLWELMTDAFGYLWTDQHGTEDVGGSWARGLAGLTGKDIALGMTRLIDLGERRAPTLPEFRALCEPRPEQIGAPPVERAYAEACRNAHPAASRRWSHPVVFHAAAAVGLQNLLRMSGGASSSRFEREYLAAVRLCIDAGEGALRQPPPDDDDTPRLVKLTDPAVVAENMAAMRAALGGRNAR